MRVVLLCVPFTDVIGSHFMEIEGEVKTHPSAVEPIFNCAHFRLGRRDTEQAIEVRTGAGFERVRVEAARVDTRKHDKLETVVELALDLAEKGEGRVNPGWLVSVDPG